MIALLGDEFPVAAVLFGVAAAESIRSIRRGVDRPLSRRTGFVLAIVLGGLALIVTGGSTDGLLAFAGCAGGPRAGGR